MLTDYSLAIICVPLLIGMALMLWGFFYHQK